MEIETIKETLLISGGGGIAFLNILSLIGSSAEAVYGRKGLPLSYRDYMSYMTEGIPPTEKLTKYANNFFAPIVYPGHVLGSLLGKGLYHFSKRCARIC